MKILIDTSKYDIEIHAKKIVKSLEEYEVRNPRDVVPRGIAFHSTKYPQTCDDCGQTYWTKEKWGAHISCQGEKKGLGF